MNEPNNLLRIDRLELRNFRCFSSCSLDLHPNLTVIVAENGQGKTALLDALRLMIDPFVAQLRDQKSAPGFEQGDIRVSSMQTGVSATSPKVELLATGWANGRQQSWTRSAKPSGDKPHTPSNSTIREIRDTAEHLRANVNNSDQRHILPAVAYYGTGRVWNKQRLSNRRRRIARNQSDRFVGYETCLAPSSAFKSFELWYGQMAIAVRDSHHRALSPEERPENLLTCVRTAVRTVLEATTEWPIIDWSFPPRSNFGEPVGSGQIVVEGADHVRLPLSQMSDGVRTMIALVGDLAHRCARLNPHLGENAARETPGIVMIDEVDMHLHPRWQQLVVSLLQNAFPSIQFILTTHSPHVLSTVNKESIRQISIRNGIGATPSPMSQTRGLESAVVLNDVMQVNPVPPVDEARWLEDYTALIETGDHETETGRILRNKLINLYGENHPIILDTNRLIRFQAFKKRKERQNPNRND